MLYEYKTVYIGYIQEYETYKIFCIPTYKKTIIYTDHRELFLKNKIMLSL